MERLQYDPLMATKLVVLQLYGVALDMNPCSACTDLEAGLNHMQEDTVSDKSKC
jgi:hypothetical protein